MGRKSEDKPELEPQQLAKGKNKRDGLYVHPKGQLSKQIKVSCSSCISGHRSGECNHFDRVLLQIRAAGRPSNTCHHSLTCGGSCLKQNAFTVPHEDPKWCRNHRSCIENWEYSDYCPPYPVSIKKKRTSSSPSRAGHISTAPALAQSSVTDKPAISPRGAESSCCSPQANRTTPGHHSGPIMPVGQPILAAAPSQLPPPSWVPRSSSDRNPFTTSFDHPSALTPDSEGFITSATHPSLAQSPQTPFLPYLDPYSVNYTLHTDKVSTSYDASLRAYIDDTAGFQGDLATAHHHELTSMANSNTIPAYSSTSTSAIALTATAPLQLQIQGQNREPQQCPGNGFQCPCDENCMCADCYTHSRGFWTLPVDLGNVQDALSEYQAPTNLFPHLARDQQSRLPRRRPGHRSDDDELVQTEDDEYVDPRNLLDHDPTLERYF